MTERFGKDNIIAPATVEEGRPYVRNVNAYYENGVFQTSHKVIVFLCASCYNLRKCKSYRV